MNLNIHILCDRHQQLVWLLRRHHKRRSGAKGVVQLSAAEYFVLGAIGKVLDAND